MVSKAEYLKKYLSSDSGGGASSKKIKKRRRVKQKNVIVHDDDIDWRTIVPKAENSDEDEDPEDAPIVAELYEEDGKRDARWKSLQASDEFPQIVKTEPLSPPPYDHTAGSNHRRHDSPDISPPRRGRVRHDSPDISPPRRGRVRHDSPDSSPPRRGRVRHDSPDISPPRRGHVRHDSPNISPPGRGRVRHDSPDISPPRKGSVRHNSPDISPPRRGRVRHDSPDISPPKRGRVRHDSPDISPPRKGRNRPDISPPRKIQRRDSPNISPKAAVLKPSSSSDGQNQMLSGAKAGLQSAHGLKDEIRGAKEAKETYYRNLDSSVSGRNAETVYRNKAGKRIDPKMEKVLSREEQRKKAEEDEKFAQWGRGVAQVKSAQEKAADDLYEMSKPLARYRDDEDLEALLKERDREGDPMLAFIKKNKPTDKHGKPKKERPMYKGNFPLNRFGIRPGYRWDGIDRSNGYEKMYFSKQAYSSAIKEEAYKWSVEEM